MTIVTIYNDGFVVLLHWPLEGVSGALALHVHFISLLKKC